MPANPLTDPNWADETTDTVIRLVGKVRDNGTTKIVHLARGVVYGIIALFLGLFAIVIFLIGLTRGIQAIFDIWFPHRRSVYISYLFVGICFSGAGLWLFKKRSKTPA